MIDRGPGWGRRRCLGAAWDSRGWKPLAIDHGPGWGRRRCLGAAWDSRGWKPLLITAAPVGAGGGVWLGVGLSGAGSPWLLTAAPVGAGGDVWLGLGFQGLETLAIDRGPGWGRRRCVVGPGISGVGSAWRSPPAPVGAGGDVWLGLGFQGLEAPGY